MNELILNSDDTQRAKSIAVSGRKPPNFILYRCQQALLYSTLIGHEITLKLPCIRSRPFPDKGDRHCLSIRLRACQRKNASSIEEKSSALMHMEPRLPPLHSARKLYAAPLGRPQKGTPEGKKKDRRAKDRKEKSIDSDATDLRKSSKLLIVMHIVVHLCIDDNTPHIRIMHADKHQHLADAGACRPQPPFTNSLARCILIDLSLLMLT